MHKNHTTRQKLIAFVFDKSQNDTQDNIKLYLHFESIQFHATVEKSGGDQT